MLGAVDAVRPEHGVGVQLLLPVEEDELQAQLWHTAHLLQARV